MRKLIHNTTLEGWQYNDRNESNGLVRGVTIEIMLLKRQFNTK
jgi:hypothetical protein